MKIIKSKFTKEILKISWPMIISELADSLYSIADTYFVSKLGTIALAAVGLGSYLSWLFFVIIVPFTIGILVYTSQSYGAGELYKARKALGETIIYALSITLGIALLVHYTTPLIVSIIAGPNSNLIDVCSKYFSVRVLGLPILAVAILFDSALRAVGATKYSMITILSSATLNIILDPILIFGLFGFPKMGVVGAAIATIISIAYMVPLGFYFLKKVNLVPIPSLGFTYITRIVRIGAPTSIERAIFALGSNIYIAFIARCGGTALAAHQVGIRIESFIYMPGFAFMVAGTSLVGKRIGEGNIVEAKNIGWETAKIATIIMTILGILVAITSKYLVLPFSPTEEVANLASIYLILAGLSEPGLAIVMTLGGGIRGGGNTTIPMIINVGGLYLFRIMPALFLINILGVIGAWLAMFVDVYLRGLTFVIVYAKYFEKLARKVI